QDVIKDFLCREVPVIRQADAIAYTTTEPNTKASFRNGASCMRCHATLDALSTISRNYQYSRTSPLGGGNLWINHVHYPSKPALDGLPKPHDHFFAVRPADGNFRYRDYQCKYHDVPLPASAQVPKASFRQFGDYLS